MEPKPKMPGGPPNPPRCPHDRTMHQGCNDCRAEYERKNKKTCPNCETLRGQIVRMREALGRYVKEQSRMLDHWAERVNNQKGRDELWRNLHFCEDPAREILSQTQDIAAWQEDRDESMRREIWKEAKKICMEHARVEEKESKVVEAQPDSEFMDKRAKGEIIASHGHIGMECLLLANRFGAKAESGGK